MKLVSFSVTNFRSITSANRLPIGNNTVLIGPNNEGKSNLLQALSVGMALIATFARPDRSRIPISMRRAYREIYGWEKDFPISLQLMRPNGQSIFRLEFELSEDEVTEFKAEIRSNLNGTLPIELRIGKTEEPLFKVLKRGPGGPALSGKANQIAQFLGGRIEFNYIPAIRTADAALDVISSMVARKLATLDKDPAYQAALRKISELQEPLLKELSDEVTKTLRTFLSDVRGVTIDMPDKGRYRSFRRDCEITVDDGTPTLLERKGDGVKSLAAISLLYGSKPIGAASILALEEPESHLHPKAIHTLKGILSDLSNRTQLVITTHNPLFVDRTTLKNNILVNNSSAKSAKSIEEIRELLGVRASDNLTHARLVLIVEGKSDKDVLIAILKAKSKAVANALQSNDLVIDFLSGSGKLNYKLGMLQAALCNSHIFVDYDLAGRQACESAIKEGLVTNADCQYTVCIGMKESELEDCFSLDGYATLVLNDFGVNLRCKEFRANKKKWSERLRETFLAQGRAWDDTVKAKIKAEVSAAVRANLHLGLDAHRCSSIEALIAMLESKLANLS